MNTNVPCHSDGDGALQLHQRLLQADPVAPAEIAATFLAPLIAWLQGVVRGADPAACGEAAGEAIVNYIQKPATYRPEKLALLAYLRMAAQRDLLNLLRRERRHQHNRRGWNLVEHSVAAGKYLGRDDDPSLPLQIAEEESRAIPDDVLRGLTDEERLFLELRLSGERRTEPFAVILGITEAPLAEQRRQVKQVKDRLDKRLERSEKRHE